MMPKISTTIQSPTVLQASTMTVRKRVIRQAAKAKLSSFLWFATACLVFSPSMAAAQNRSGQAGTSSEQVGARPDFSVPATLWSEAVRSTDRGNEPLRFNTFAELAEALSPAVVNIDVTLPGPSIIGASGQATGQGSGFIIHRDGFVVTNAHVIHRASKIQVTTSDRKVWDAVVVGLDTATDLALLRIVGPEAQIPRGGFPIARLADSSRVRPGEWVIAIGNPFGLQHSVTAGIVSAIGRRDVNPGSTLRYADFIQFDAAINLGNSGGPLINVNGEVVGVNTALRTGNNIGFAIPANMLKTLLPQLGRGEVVRAWLGVRLADLTTDEIRSLGLAASKGARVVGVVSEGPAAQAGLQPGDVIVEFEGREVDDAAQLRWLTAICEIGQDVEMKVRRGANTITVRAKLTAPVEEATTGPQRGIERTERGSERIDLNRYVDFAEIDDEIRVRNGLGATPAVIVTRVQRGTILAGAGLREGDFLTHVNNVAVSSPSEAAELLRKVEPGKMVQFRLRRGSAQMFIGFTAP